MSHTTPEQPKLADLMARYLKQRTQAHDAGLAAFDPSDEVVPYDAGPVQPVDPRPAWEAAIAAAPFLIKDVDTRSWSAPPDWPQLVACQEPVVVLAFSIGNYPQLMRDLHLILHKANPADLRPQSGRSVDVPELIAWARQIAAKKIFAQMLVAAGALRLARQFDLAGDYLRDNDPAVPQEWRSAWSNERASLAWHRGAGEEALKDWEAQEASVPVLFNRGMAALFLGQPAAQAPLAEAVAKLPEASPWHHLGMLYLTLAQNR
jgi:hypothetical protein